METLSWPRLLDNKASKQPHLDMQQLQDVWTNKAADSYGTAATLSTTALLLWLANDAPSIEAAQTQAEALWQQRHI